MGSISYEIDRAVDAKQEALRYVREDALGAGREIVDHSFQSAGRWSEWGGVLVAAVRELTPECEQESVWALVAYFGVNSRHGGREFFVKLVDETMGPGEYSVPLRLLNKLSPTEHQYATQWRDGVRRFHQRRREARRLIGTSIRLACPLTFADPVGDVVQVHVTSMTRWVDVDSGYILRAPDHWWMREYSAV